jgi:hypothetical protein
MNHDRISPGRRATSWKRRPRSAARRPDVPAGEYRMSAFIRAPVRIVRFHEFTVPAINEKLSQRPVDLGILMLNPGHGH